VTAQQDLTFYAKRDNTVDVSIITAAGNPVDLTGYDLVLTIKKLITDSDASALYQGKPAFFNAPFGKFSFLVPLATTSNAAWAAASSGVHDISAITPSKYSVTLLAGASTIVQPVTQTIPALAAVV
jgi:hypothetical protein